MNVMEIPVDQRLHELTRHGEADFPIQYYVDRPRLFPRGTIPLHWHGELEFWKAEGGDAVVQAGARTFSLARGCAVLINSNVLHSFRQPDGARDLDCPNIVFKDELIAPVSGRAHRKYVAPLVTDPRIPYLLLAPGCPWHEEILAGLERVFQLLRGGGPCYEMAVQEELIRIWRVLFLHRDGIPRVQAGESRRHLQISVQKMLSFIHSRYGSPVTLADIAAAAGISKSQAARCFQDCLHTSPVSYLLAYRIEMAKHALAGGLDTVGEISAQCGFQSASYFCRLFRAQTGMTPLQYRTQAPPEEGPPDGPGTPRA